MIYDALTRGSFKSNTGWLQWCLSAKMMGLRDPCSQEISCSPYAKGLLQGGTVDTGIYNPPILLQGPFSIAAAIPECEGSCVTATLSCRGVHSFWRSKNCSWCFAWTVEKIHSILQNSYTKQSPGHAFLLVLRKTEMVHHTKAMAGPAHSGLLVDFSAGSWLPDLPQSLHLGIFSFHVLPVVSDQRSP